MASSTSPTSRSSARTSRTAATASWMPRVAARGERSKRTTADPLGRRTHTRPAAPAAGLARFRSSDRSAELLRDALRLEEQEQVVASARLAVGAAHVEAAERMAADHRAGALAVQVQVADEELVARALELRRVPRVDRAREPVVRVVRDLE